MQFTRIEASKVLIPLHYITELDRHFFAGTGQQHPQILDRWAHAAIVKINKVWAVVSVEDIAEVAVTMQANQLNVPGAGITLGNFIERLIGNTLPRRE